MHGDDEELGRHERRVGTITDGNERVGKVMTRRFIEIQEEGRGVPTRRRHRRVYGAKIEAARCRDGDIVLHWKHDGVQRE